MKLTRILGAAFAATMLLLVGVADAQPLEFRAAQGADGLDSEFKFGFNADIGGTEETLWDEGGLYTYPSAAGQWNVSSSRVEDVSTGTGARTVEIFGLNAGYVLTNETVTMDGQNGVTLTNSYIRVFRGITRTAGASEFNGGDIYVGTGAITLGVPVTKYLKISAEQNQTLMALWTVPANTWFYLTDFLASTFGQANQSLEFRLLARPENEVFQVKHRFLLFRSPVEWRHAVPRRFAPKTDLEVRAKASGGSIDGSASFQGVMMSQ